MNLQQLEYIVAIDTHRHFAKAAAACFVTQPTLSSMVKKLEIELGVTLFDRTKSPVVPTAIGTTLIEQARAVLKETAVLKHLAEGTRELERGELRIGMIPTLAPYLLPLFLGRLLKEHPFLKVSIEELTTETIIDRLTRERLDVGVLATPLNVPGLKEDVLFRERFFVYASDDERFGRKRYVLPADIDPDRLWLLEEGHCLRSQVMNLCELRRKGGAAGHLEYVSGSIDALLRMVDTQGGLTIVPELATFDMDRKRKARLREFKAPAPVREISTVTYRHFMKDRLLQRLRAVIMAEAGKRLANDPKAPVVGIAP
ncbi:MAG TPA: hydrogen peroxide-inducible genes activator [Flavobacteriales bacterium]|jgi:LysR family hydrogen peroxide-inducible transcriptional activator|nr:hydrogen peroxide-inducible genes activator [Flavobacteriales bacterium]